MRIHQIKLDAEFAEPVLFGEKCFEVRFNDRGYQKGDMVDFKVVGIPEVTVANAEKVKQMKRIAESLEKIRYVITYVLNGWGIKNGYVVFGFEECGGGDDGEG